MPALTSALPLRHGDLAANPAPAQTTTSPTTHTVKPSTFEVITSPIEPPSRESLFLRLMVDEVELATGTGFLAGTKDNPLLITCRHLVTGRDQNTGAPLHKTAALPNAVIVTHNGPKVDGGVDTIVPLREPLHDAAGRPIWLEHPILREKADIIAIPLTRKDGIVIHLVDPRHAKNPISCRPSDMLSIVGYPFGKTGGGQMALWVTAFIASEPSVPYDGLPIFFVDSRSRPGQSGSPVIAYRTGIAIRKDGSITMSGPESAAYQFMGVYSGRISAESDIGTVWNASIVQELVANGERAGA